MNWRFPASITLFDQCVLVFHSLLSLLLLLLLLFRKALPSSWMKFLVGTGNSEVRRLLGGKGILAANCQNCPNRSATVDVFLWGASQRSQDLVTLVNKTIGWTKQTIERRPFNAKSNRAAANREPINIYHLLPEVYLIGLRNSYRKRASRLRTTRTAWKLAHFRQIYVLILSSQTFRIPSSSSFFLTLIHPLCLIQHAHMNGFPQQNGYSGIV